MLMFFFRLSSQLPAPERHGDHVPTGYLLVGPPQLAPESSHRLLVLRPQIGQLRLLVGIQSTPRLGRLVDRLLARLPLRAVIALDD